MTWEEGGMPIKIAAYYTEKETCAKRACPDIQDIADKIAEAIRMMGTPKYNEIRQNALNSVSKYDYDNIAKRWEKFFDEMPIKDRNKTWGAPLNIITPTITTLESLLSLPDDEFIATLYEQFGGERLDKKDKRVLEIVNQMKRGLKKEVVVNKFLESMKKHNELEMVRYRGPLLKETAKDFVLETAKI